jgi:hypothetical protein
MMPFAEGYRRGSSLAVVPGSRSTWESSADLGARRDGSLGCETYRVMAPLEQVNGTSVPVTEYTVL